MAKRKVKISGYEQRCIKNGFKILQGKLDSLERQVKREDNINFSQEHWELTKYFVTNRLYITEKLSQKNWTTVTEKELGCVVFLIAIYVAELEPVINLPKLGDVAKPLYNSLAAVFEILINQMSIIFPETDIENYVYHDGEGDYSQTESRNKNIEGFNNTSSEESLSVISEVITQPKIINQDAFNDKDIINLIDKYKCFVKDNRVDELTIGCSDPKFYAEITSIVLTGMDYCAGRMINDLHNTVRSHVNIKEADFDLVYGNLIYSIVDIVLLFDKTIPLEEFIDRLISKWAGSKYAVSDGAMSFEESLRERRENIKDTSVNSMLSTNMQVFFEKIGADINDDTIISLYNMFIKGLLYCCEFKAYSLKYHLNKAISFEKAEELYNLETDFIEEARAKGAMFPRNNMMAYTAMGAISVLVLNNPSSNLISLKDTIAGLNLCYYPHKNSWDKDKSYYEGDVIDLNLVGVSLAQEWLQLLQNKDVDIESEQFIEASFEMLIKRFRMDRMDNIQNDINVLHDMYGDYIKKLRGFVDKQ